MATRHIFGVFALTIDIIEAARKGVASLRRLQERGLIFERDQRGGITPFVGNNAVVFRVMIDGERYAMRCYRSSKPHLREIYGDGYYSEEMLIETFGLRERWIDVVVVKWVEGVSLSSVVDRAMRCDVDTICTEMERLSKSFDRLAIEMISQGDWAHGDLSGDNIIVDEEYRMSVVDNDSNYVESLRGCERSEAGTPAYQPRWSFMQPFGASMDHFSIALISLSLHAMAIEPDLYLRDPFVDGLLLDGERVGTSCYHLLDDVTWVVSCAGDFVAARMARLLLSDPKMLEVELPPLFGFLNRSGEAEDLDLFERSGIWGYRSVGSGEVVIPPLFDEAFGFYLGEARVRVSRWWFYIDSEGRVVERCGDLDGAKPPRRR